MSFKHTVRNPYEIMWRQTYFVAADITVREILC